MPTTTVIQERVNAVDWEKAAKHLTETGYALTRPLLEPQECSALVELFSQENHFRSHVVMERYRFGKGDYRYFRYPLPENVESLRTATYPRLAKIANDWNAQLGNKSNPFPLDHQEFLARCDKAGQKQATPLLL